MIVMYLITLGMLLGLAPIGAAKRNKHNARKASHPPRATYLNFLKNDIKTKKSTSHQVRPDLGNLYDCKFRTPKEIIGFEDIDFCKSDLYTTRKVNAEVYQYHPTDIEIDIFLCRAWKIDSICDENIFLKRTKIEYKPK
jgi:hypothetical protein